MSPGSFSRASCGMVITGNRESPRAKVRLPRSGARHRLQPRADALRQPGRFVLRAASARGRRLASHREKVRELETLRRRVGELERELAPAATTAASAGNLWHAAMDAMLEGCQILAHDWRYLYVNPAAERHNRRPASELLGQCYADMWPGITETTVYAEIRRALVERVPGTMLNEFEYPDGQHGWFELRFEPVPEGVLILSVDVTARRRDELRIEHFGRVLDAIRRVEHLISREKNEAALAQAACDALVSSGSFASAWLVTLAPGGERLKYGSVGLGAPGEAFHARLERGLRPPCWPLVTESGDDCLVLPDPQVCGTCPLGDGLTSGDALVAPVRHEGEHFGALGVRLGPGGNAEEDRELLVQIADDLGLALHDMRAEGRRSAYQQIVECTDDGLALVGPGHEYLEANAAYARYWGWTGGISSVERFATSSATSSTSAWPARASTAPSRERRSRWSYRSAWPETNRESRTSASRRRSTRPGPSPAS